MSHFALQSGVFASAGSAELFLLGSAVGMHDFWTLGDPQEQQAEMTQFLKNVTLAGGAIGSWRSAESIGPTRSASACSNSV